MPCGNPFAPIWNSQPAVILDGGLATTLEDRGHDLDDDLWSARLLLDDPGAIAAVHREFLGAGADCLITATYQASFPGLAQRGYNDRQARDLILLAVDLALKARDDFWGEAANRQGRLRPLVAASVGPYGAFLADGSEYTGRYAAGPAELERFHRQRWQILAGSRADLLACETLPNLAEAEILVALLNETPDRWAWFSFSCRDGNSLWDGTPLEKAIALCASCDRTAAVGVNCTAPQHVGPLLAIARRVTDKPLIAYPNSGDAYDPSSRTWARAPRERAFTELAAAWMQMGAKAVGGCCRIGPRAIAALRRGLLD